jgi:hypothetical protein
VAEVPELVERVVVALGRLAAIGETVEDEWTYVRDLETVWAARLRAVAAAERPAGTHPPVVEIEAAVDRVLAEVDRITDPHRAIDWLSTLPQVTLVALGEAAW